MIGLVEAEDLKPNDLVGVNKERSRKQPRKELKLKNAPKVAVLFGKQNNISCPKTLSFREFVFKANGVVLSPPLPGLLSGLGQVTP